MQYLRDRYKNEIGYSYPEEFDKVEFYVEWLERIIEGYDKKTVDANRQGDWNH